MPQSNHFRETLDGVARHAEWAELEAKGWSRARIAEHAKVARSTVTRGIDGLLADIKVDAVSTLRKHERERLRLLIESAFGDLDKAIDPPVRSKLREEIRRHAESLRRLDGVDMPVRHEMTVITRDATEQAIAELEARLAADDARTAGSPSPA